METPRTIKLPRIGESTLGYISVMENNDRLLPFDVKRVYWTYYTPEQVERGNHAHIRLRQVIVAVSGRIELRLISQNNESSQYILDSPDIGLYIPGGYWREIRFSHNAVLLCLASQTYNEDDYIRDFHQFLNLDTL